MKIVIVILLWIFCVANSDPQINPSTFEWEMISSSNNYPDIDLKKDSIDLLLISLHLHMSPKSIQKKIRWNENKYINTINLLEGKNFLIEKYGSYYPNIMIITEKEEPVLYKYAEPFAIQITDSIVTYLEIIKAHYMESEISTKINFDSISFFLLSNVLMDNWKINNIEREFLKKERPVRHGKNYYFAFLQNSNPQRKTFGIFRNT